MEDFVEIYFSTRRKKTITGRGLWKMENKDGFHWPKNLFSLAGISLPQ